ncbi:NUDIX domain-containing protein [Streptomyces triticagri]|uniref:NUDIX domain-containing protein n=2 Tax=Streptomyces triticagri TaxID=2293568 RepID=A0A372MB50_9ACTN|nr:NUDIX domain-containing protein [Streptomyces triticagri]
MTDASRTTDDGARPVDSGAAAQVLFDGGRLVLLDDPGEHGSYHLPRIDGGARHPASARSGSSALSLDEALWCSVRPLGTAEHVLRAWATGTAAPGPVPWEDPESVAPVRVRAGAIVIREAQMLLIRFDEKGRTHYEIPGGGVEPGETLTEAVVRELREETALEGTARHEVARVWKDGRREHYFRVDATGEVGAPEHLDNYGGAPAWMPLDRLPDTPLWPRRLAWRIPRWHRTAWPGRPLELADSIDDLDAWCGW